MRSAQVFFVDFSEWWKGLLACLCGCSALYFPSEQRLNSRLIVEIEQPTTAVIVCCELPACIWYRCCKDSCRYRFVIVALIGFG